MASTTPKGYWIARVDVTNPEAYDRYLALNSIAFAKFGAKCLVRAPAGLNPRGSQRGVNVVLEFADYETALACYHSAEYQAALPFLDQLGVVDLVIVPGN